MSNKRSAISLDPDYEDVTEQQNKRQRIYEEGAKEATISKIQSIVKSQFQEEIRIKEREVESIDQGLHHARAMLDRLRACIVATYYTNAGQLGSTQSKPSSHQPSIHPTVKKHLGKTLPATCVEQPQAKSSVDPTHTKIGELKNGSIGDVTLTQGNGCLESGDVVAETDDAVAKQGDSAATQDRGTGDAVQPGVPSLLSSPGTRSGRFKTKKRIIVGNVSKYIPYDKRDENDHATHKWMVYVRGSKEEPHIGSFVKKVWFFLHPSYKPNDLVEISQPPFHLTRRGWGEFPIRVQLHFKDSRNRRVDVLHNLKLDRTYTGLQTLGAETVVDIELEKDQANTTVIKSMKQNNISSASQEHKKHEQFRKLSLQPQVKQESNLNIEEETRFESPAKKLKLDAVGDFKNDAASNVEQETISSPTQSIGGKQVQVKSKMSPKSKGSRQKSNTTGNLSEVVKEDLKKSSDQPSGTSDQSLKDILQRQLRMTTLGTERSISGVKNQQKTNETTPVTSPVKSLQNTPDNSSKVQTDKKEDIQKTSSGLKSKGATQYQVSKSPGQVAGQVTVSSLGTTLGTPKKDGAVKSPNPSPTRTQQTGATPGVGPSNVYVRCIDGQGKVYLIPQHLLVKVPTGNINLAGLQLKSAVAASNPATGVSNAGRIMSNQGKSQGKNIQSPSLSLPGQGHIISLGQGQFISLGQGQQSPKPIQAPAQLLHSFTPQTLSVSPIPSQLSQVQVTPNFNLARMAVPKCRSATPSQGSQGSRSSTPQSLVSRPDTPSSLSPNSSQRYTSSSESAKLSRPGTPLSADDSRPSTPQGSSLLGKTFTISGTRIGALNTTPKKSDIAGAGFLSQQRNTGQVSILKNVGGSQKTSNPKQGNSSTCIQETAVIKTDKPFDSNLSEIPKASSLIASVSHDASVSMVTPPATPTKLEKSVGAGSPGKQVSLTGCGSTLISTGVGGQVLIKGEGLPGIVLLGGGQQSQENSSNKETENRTGSQFIIMGNAGTQNTANVGKSIGANSKHTLGTTTAVPPAVHVSGNKSPSKSSLKNTPAVLGSQVVNIGNQTLLLQMQPLQQATAGTNQIVLVPGTSGITTAQTSQSPPVSYQAKGSSLHIVNSTQSQQSSWKQKNWLKGNVLNDRGIGKEEKPLNLQNVDDMECLVHLLIKQHPLVCDTVDRHMHPYCAKSEENFFKWNIGKRRAAEWQRACWVKKKIKGLLGIEEEYKGEKVWTTKQIMMWCRYHCYTPLHASEKQQNDMSAYLQPDQKFSSYTSATDLTSRLQDLPLKKDAEEEEEDVEIDVIGLATELPKPIKKESPQKPSSKLFSLPSLPAEEFVHESARQIGIDLKPVEVYTDVLGPVLEGIMLSAMTNFADDIIRTAFSLASQNRGFPEELTTADIYRALCKLKKCDILTNCNLGVQTDQSHGDKAQQGSTFSQLR